MKNHDIYQFTNYRDYLRSYYERQKKNGPRFSYRSWSKKAGFTSSSFIKMVIEGKKNLSKSGALKLAVSLELDEKGQEYFENIVFFDQAKTFSEKKWYLDRIDRFHTKNKPKDLPPLKYDYLKQWYHTLMREIVSLPWFNEDLEEIVKNVNFTLSPKEVKSSLRFLLENGFLERNKEGNLIKKEKTLATGDIVNNQVFSLIVRDYHRKMSEISTEAITNIQAERRCTSNTTFSISKEAFQYASERIKALRYELLELAASDNTPDNVYQLSINLFPLTKSK